MCNYFPIFAPTHLQSGYLDKFIFIQIGHKQRIVIQRQSIALLKKVKEGTKTEVKVRDSDEEVTTNKLRKGHFGWL